MATRERRLAEFNGEGQPAPDQPVQVLCEDHSGTYQLPFPCRFIDGTWRNHRIGRRGRGDRGRLAHATLIIAHANQRSGLAAVPKCNGSRRYRRL